MRRLRKARVSLGVLALCALTASPAPALRPCISCRTEKCPSKENVGPWCGEGRDPKLPPLPPQVVTVPPKKKDEPKGRPVVCDAGRAASVATKGHCCWPDQEWSVHKKKCIGIPACPDGLEARREECVAKARPAVVAPVAPAIPVSRCPEDMAYLEGGTFKMGERGDVVTVQPFCLDKTEVTVAAYGKCSACGAAGNCNQGKADRQNHPINCVDWMQAVAYCKHQGRELPSEEQWEWAARGGARGTTYPWGNADPGKQLCWDGEGIDLIKGNRYSTCPVASYPTGDAPGGIHDLAGNVWEWTTSKYDEKSRGVRGGSWLDLDPAFFRASYRNYNASADRIDHLGFRCARIPL